MMTSALLMQLGITPNYDGYRQAESAVALARREPDALHMVCKWLYPAVAKECGTTWQCVERNVRSVAGMAWKNNPELLCKLARYPFEKRPTAAQFIAILCEASEEQETG